jgi:hypothetical protein
MTRFESNFGALGFVLDFPLPALLDMVGYRIIMERKFIIAWQDLTSFVFRLKYPQNSGPCLRIMIKRNVAQLVWQ